MFKTSSTSKLKTIQMNSIIVIFIQILITLTYISSNVESQRNQQIIIDFDEDQTITNPLTTESTQVHDDDQDRNEKINQESKTKSNRERPVPIPVATGLTARLIKKFTGWNDTVVAKLTGQISSRPPHPFVTSIDDENYESVIESDLDLIQSGWGSDQDTVWVISVVATDRSSILFDEVFDKLASNSSLSTNPIPSKKRDDEIDIIRKDIKDPYLFNSKIKFGRIDYMAKTDFILTKWLIFKCPVLVVITNRGKDLRFFKTGSVPPTADHLGDFLRQERWLLKPTWNSTFSKGNSGEWVVTLAARSFQGFHVLTDKVPGWILMVLSSMLGTSVMQWLHKPKPKPKLQDDRTKTRDSTQVSSSLTKSNDLNPSTSSPTPNHQNQNQNQSDLNSQDFKKDLADSTVQLIKILDQKNNAISNDSRVQLNSSNAPDDSSDTKLIRKRKP